MFVCPPLQNAYVNVVMLDVMVLVGRVFGWCLNHEGETLINGISLL